MSAIRGPDQGRPQRIGAPAFRDELGVAIGRHRREPQEPQLPVADPGGFPGDQMVHHRGHAPAIGDKQECRFRRAHLGPRAQGFGERREQVPSHGMERSVPAGAGPREAHRVEALTGIAFDELGGIGLAALHGLAERPRDYVASGRQRVLGQ